VAASQTERQQVVILAGGLATRMRPLTETIPKSLIPVAGRPFADHQLRWLAAEGVSDVVFAIGYRGEQLAEFVRDGSRWGLRVRYSEEGERLLGTAGALRLAYDQGLLEPAFGVLYGDSYLAAALRSVWRRFAADTPIALMTVYRNAGRFDRSNARLLDGFVVHYEKGLADPASAGMHHIDYGFSIIDRDAVMPLIAPHAVSDLASIYTRLSREGRLGGYEVHERFYEIGSPEGLAELESLLSRAARS
jgi:MurNAc alpha-1-phosphate uridylyltransferase